MENKTFPQADIKLAAVCGLFCPACTIYIGTHEDPARLKRFADERHLTIEQASCDGCRSARRIPFCATCNMYACAAEKGLDFCGACADFPCEDIRQFQSARPHRIELFANQARIREVGFEAWFAEMLAYYACPNCGTLNSAYDEKCRACGAQPSCAYVANNTEGIRQRLAQMKS